MEPFVWKAAIGLVACAIFLSCTILVESRKSKHKIHYYFAAGGILGTIIVAVIAMLMDRFGLFLPSIFALLLICLISIATSRTVFLEDRAKDLRTFDASAPLCFNDFFSWRFVVKCERKYGERKALAIYLLLMAGLTGLSAVIMYYWVMIELTPTLRGSGALFFILPMVVIVVIFSHGSFNSEYRFIKKRLEQQQNTPTALVGEQKFCTGCGMPNVKDVRYCPKCGKKFSE